LQGLGNSPQKRGGFVWGEIGYGHQGQYKSILNGKLTYTGSKRHDALGSLLVLRQFEPLEAIVIGAVKPMAFNVTELR
jgi:hypothetical protein